MKMRNFFSVGFAGLVRLMMVGVLFQASVAAAAIPGTPAPTASGAAADEYRLGPGDVIRISVYQNQDLSFETRLSDGGNISFPLLGSMHVGGQTVGAVERLLADGLKKGEFVKNPQVTVILMQARGSQVNVLGQVNKPGRYALEQAGTRVSDVLAMAGGAIPNIGGESVTVVGQRDGQAFRRQIDIDQIFASGQRSDDLVLQGNDVIYVARAPQIYIYGEVQRPGQMRLERGMTLLQGLAAGGGLTQRGTEKGIRIHRRGAAGKVEVLQHGMDEALQDGDVIFVRESLF